MTISPTEPTTRTDDIVVSGRDGDVAVVELNRPPHNLLDAELLESLDRAFDAAVADGCRSLLISSRLRHFCAGADLQSLQTGALARLDLIGFLHRLEELPIPTVAAVHGAALGGGLELALGCDLIVAAESAQLGLVETSLGLFPLMGGVQRLVAAAGPARASEVALLGRRYPAATFEQWGVINQVVADDALPDAARSLARQLAAGPPLAFRAIKELRNAAGRGGVASADDLTADVAAPVWQSADLEVGVREFLDTGRPGARFTGS